MSLRRPYPGPVEAEREAPLGIRRHDRAKIFRPCLTADSCKAAQERVHPDPATGAEREPEQLRLMSQGAGEKTRGRGHQISETNDFSDFRIA